MKFAKKLAAVSLAFIGASGTASAESQFVTLPAVGTQSATARLDFRITIPRFLFLRVGTGNAFGAANNTTINLIDFNIPAASVGTNTAATPFAANGSTAATQGDIGAGTVTARLVANSWSGTATLTATAGGPLSNGTETIDYTKIGVTTAALAGVASLLTHPATLTNGVTSFTGVTATTGTKVIERGAQWTFAYANDAVVADGVYGQTAAAAGASVNNGRIVYTATQP